MQLPRAYRSLPRPSSQLKPSYPSNSLDTYISICKVGISCSLHWLLFQRNFFLWTTRKLNFWISAPPAKLSRGSYAQNFLRNFVSKTFIFLNVICYWYVGLIVLGISQLFPFLTNLISWSSSHPGQTYFAMPFLVSTVTWLFGQVLHPLQSTSYNNTSVEFPTGTRFLPRVLSNPFSLVLGSAI